MAICGNPQGKKECPCKAEKGLDRTEKVDPAEVSKYAQVAQDILKGIGGKDNVVSASYCTTRLRFVVKNYNQVNEQAVKAAGASGIIRPGKNACQVIVGTKVKSIYDELDKLLK